eukprot:364400-Chlamydomonas_euryale.AAC.1
MAHATVLLEHGMTHGTRFMAGHTERGSWPDTRNAVHGRTHGTRLVMSNAYDKRHGMHTCVAWVISAWA